VYRRRVLVVVGVPDPIDQVVVDVLLDPVVGDDLPISGPEGSLTRLQLSLLIPSVDDIDELFNEWFWYFIWCGYSREAACRMAARRVLVVVGQFEFSSPEISVSVQT
jgi:hypothetical protein